MKITVTKDDIRQGKRGFARQCAVALAMQHVLPAGASVVVYGSNARINGERVELPKLVSEFVRRFDNKVIPKKTLKPFTFNLKYKLSR